MPSNNCDTKFIISNTTDAPVTATITVDGTSPGQQTPAEIQLNAHETRVLDVIRDLVRKNNGTIHTTGGVSISHTGAAGAILARMLISKASKGFSSTMNFIDPQMTGSSKWHGAGLHLGKVNNQKLEQILVARNVGGETTVVRGKIPYTNNNGEVVLINIPPTNIAPNSTKTINLQNAIGAANVPASVKYAGLEINYSTPKGSVVMSAVSVSPDNNQVFQIPLYDPQKTPPSAGGYPWKADGDFTTVVYIKNDTDQPQKYVASLHYEGGGYSLGIKEIKPHQLAAIDFRQLRDNQTPDVNGKIIPFNIERGQIAWSGKYTPSGALNGRSIQSSLSQGISSTYDCRNFCRDSYYDGYLIYDLPLQYVDDVANFEAYQQDMNAFGYPTTPYPVTANWQSTDPSCAGINYTGEATALAAGTAFIQGSWLAERFIGEVGNEECNFESFTALIEEFIDIVGPTVTLNVPTSAFDGDMVQFSVSVQGGTATAYQWSFEPTSGGNNPQVNFSDPTGAMPTAKAHWFAKPDSECGAYLSSKYTIKVKVTFENGKQITKSAPFTVSIGSNWGGSVDYPTTPGNADISFDSERNLWKVNGPGSLQRIPSPIVMITPETSQFYIKTLKHEQEHEKQYIGNRIFSDLYQINTLMPRLLLLTDPNKQPLEQKIFQAKEAWRAEQKQIVIQRLPQAEKEAYAVSDPIAPRYKFQAKCNGF